MPEKRRTFETDVLRPEQLRVKPAGTRRVGTDLGVCPEEAGVISEKQVNGFSRETVLRLIEWIKQV